MESTRTKYGINHSWCPARATTTSLVRVACPKCGLEMVRIHKERIPVGAYSINDYFTCRTKGCDYYNAPFAIPTVELIELPEEYMYDMEDK